jgi:hypothetical protein
MVGIPSTGLKLFERSDIISVTVITVTGLLVIVNYESMTPAMAGMALAFAIQVCIRYT